MAPHAQAAAGGVASGTASPSSARYVPQRERYVHKLHRDRLASIKPTVDCHTPSTVNMKHLAHRLKKKQLADGEKTRPLFQRASESHVAPRSR